MTTACGVPVERGIWIDDPHPVFRRGLAASLVADGFRVAGESSGLKPFPDPARVRVLLFEADDAGLRRVASLAEHDIRLVAVMP